jgi:hypothetical protein
VVSRGDTTGLCEVDWANVRALYRTHQLLFVGAKGFDDLRRKYQVVKKDYQDKFRRRLTSAGMFFKDPTPFESVKLE